MNAVIEKALQSLAERGFKARVVSVTHLPELREDIAKWQRQGLLAQDISDTYMRWEYDIAKVLPGAQSIVVVAVPQPVTRARFTWQGRTHNADIPPTYIGKADDARVKETLAGVLEPAGNKMVRARLPVKTLAVRSGLAQYGRNNITYVPGFGSYHRLLAFITDCPSEADNWQELKAMKACDNCFKCGDSCPTGCIPEDRFLIDAGKCLTWFNENKKELPAWIQPSWHNALIGCMRCQTVCPVNANQLKNIVDGPLFSGEETSLILQKTPMDKLGEETHRKLAEIAADESYPTLARNLKLLIQSQYLASPTP